MAGWDFPRPDEDWEKEYQRSLGTPLKRKTLSIALRKSVKRRKESVRGLDPCGIFLWFIENEKCT